MAQDDDTTRPYENTAEPQPQSDMVKDWSTDYFPTSAKPVFIGWTIMVVGVATLCALVYFFSPHPEDPAKIKKQNELKEKIQLDDEED